MRRNVRTRLFLSLLLLCSLLLAGCTAGPQNPPEPFPSIAPSKPTTIQPGPGLWPTNMPAPPSPTVTPPSASDISPASGHEAELTKPLPPTIPSTNTVATSKTPDWTTFESINDVHDLAFAPDGSLWAATGGGLVHWNLDAQASAEPPYARYPIPAWALDIAPDGSLWLALEQGLCHFDGLSCETYSQADGLLGNNIYALVVDPNGSVWLGTEQGVSRFDGNSWQSYPSPVATHDLAVTASGEVWAATAGGVGRYLPAEDGWITYTSDQGLPASNVQVIATGPNGEVWAYLVWEGVYRFDGAGWQEVEGAGNLVSDITFASDGTSWVAQAGSLHYPGGSLAYYDGEGWHDVSGDQVLSSFASIALGPGDAVATSTQLGLGLYEGGEWRLLRDGPTRDSVTSVAVTPDGATWFAFGDHSVSTPGWGLSRFDGQKWDYFLDDAEVDALTAGPDGTLWAGVGCSIQRFDGTSWKTVAPCGVLPLGGALDIGFAPDGTVWVASGPGLTSFDGEAWTDHERMVHSLEVAPDGTIWLNGLDPTQLSSYVARFDGQTWTTFDGADSFPGGFSVAAITPDGLLWGMAPHGRLASFDGRSWADGESWTFYDTPGSPALNDITLLTGAPDGALWLAIDGAIARFDPGSPPGEAWITYTRGNGLPESHYPALAFGPGGEIWFGATRFRPAGAEANAEEPAPTPQVLETTVPVATITDSELPAPYCRPSEAFVDLSVPATRLKVGQSVTVTVTLANGDGSDAQLGQIQYTLDVQPETLVSDVPEPVQHPITIEPGDSDQARFVLHTTAPGELLLTASASYEIHALDYSWASWSGCQSGPLEITIAPR